MIESTTTGQAKNCNWVGKRENMGILPLVNILKESLLLVTKRILRHNKTRKILIYLKRRSHPDAALMHKWDLLKNRWYIMILLIHLVLSVLILVFRLRKLTRHGDNICLYLLLVVSPSTISCKLIFFITSWIL